MVSKGEVRINEVVRYIPKRFTQIRFPGQCHKASKLNSYLHANHSSCNLENVNCLFFYHVYASFISICIHQISINVRQSCNSILYHLLPFNFLENLCTFLNPMTMCNFHSMNLLSWFREGKDNGKRFKIISLFSISMYVNVPKGFQKIHISFLCPKIFKELI